MKSRRRDVAEAIFVLAALAFAAGLGAIGWVVGDQMSSGGTVTVTAEATPASPAATETTAPVSPEVAAGAHVFVQFACGACHGEQGRGDVSPDVPRLDTIGQALTEEELGTIIRKGLGEPGDASKPYMPVWGPLISARQVAELVAYIQAGLPAVPGAEAPVAPTHQGPEVAGAVLYQRYGCVNCHGPNGLGGVPNPADPAGPIPPLSGRGFRREFDTDEAILTFIRDGSVLGEAPIVSMPHWGGIIPDRDLQSLLAYLKSLKP
jgi:mono/diheme cytochrome c family protein